MNLNGIVATFEKILGKLIPWSLIKNRTGSGGGGRGLGAPLGQGCFGRFAGFPGSLDVVGA